MRNSYTQWVVVLGSKEHCFWNKEAMERFCSEVLDAGPHLLSYKVYVRDIAEYLYKEKNVLPQR